MPWCEEDLLILTKTYPNPSQKYRETTCVAALTRNGELRRIYPVPFRLLEGNAQFKRWEWIRARIIKARDDLRPESYKIDVDSIVRSNRTVSSSNQWTDRRKLIEPHIVRTPAALEERRQRTGETVGILPVTSLLGLEITPEKETDWTEEERTKLSQQGLFDSEEVRSRMPLRKVPFRFHYRYECTDGHIREENRHLILDWEAAALYWNCLRLYGARWEDKFRQKLEVEFSQKGLHLMMGTVHRFPDQWLIIGLFYPPRLHVSPDQTLSLF